MIGKEREEEGMAWEIVLDRGSENEI